jgi:hypothetical protein
LSRHDAVRWLALPGSAFLALCVGVSVYIVERDWATTLFLAPFVALQGEQSDFFGSLGNVMPAFCHAYAFALMLILVLGRSRRARLAGASLWFSIAAVLEVLQAERFSTAIDGSTALTAAAPVFNSLSSYLLSGRFDYGDLVATGLGCVLAFLISSVLEEMS